MQTITQMIGTGWEPGHINRPQLLQAAVESFPFNKRGKLVSEMYRINSELKTGSGQA